MTARYEQLRSHALHATGCFSRTPGAVLLVRNGMAAWMQAGMVRIAGDGSQALTTRATRPRPLDSRTQMATMLADVLLNQRWEANR
jgi:hypothetical protein